MGEEPSTPIERYVRRMSRQGLVVALIGVLLFTSVFAALQGITNAAQVQVTSRSASIDKPNVSSTNIAFTFGYTLVTSQAYQSLTYQFCTTPIGACTTPTGLVANTGVSHTSQTGFPTNATAFAVRGTSTDLNNCLMSSAQFSCYTRTAATAGNGAVTHVITGVTGPTVAGTVYIRVVAYPTTDYSGTTFDYGTVAVSFNQRLTINARVQEQLTFCVGTTTTNAVGANGTNPIINSSAANVTSCSNADGTSVDLGVIGTTTAAVTPVSSTTGGDARNAYALVLSNGVSGVVISYKAVQDGANGGRLKVLGQTCSGTSSLDAGSGGIDQCFNTTGTQTVLTASVEQFGMTIAGVSCYIVPVAASGGYTCNYTAGSFNLAPQSGYIGAAANAYGTTNGFAWVQNGTATTIASSASSTIRSVYYEGLIIKFGAVATTSTPTGSYAALADFIATPTF